MIEHIERILEIFAETHNKRQTALKIYAETKGIVASKNQIRAVEKLIQRREKKAGVLVECEKEGINPEKINHYWYKGKHYSINVEGDRKDKELDFDSVIAECMEKYIPVPSKIPQYQDTVVDRLVWSDVHVGMDASRKGLALYPVEWDGQMLMDNVRVMADFVIQNKQSNVLYIDELGDFMDGWDGETTRKGHKLPQNMTNEEAFDYGLKAKVLLVDILQPHFENIICNNICEDNHCFDDKTEVLTNNGWKFYTDVLDTDKIATVSKGIVEYQKPSRKIYNPVNKVIKMHHYHSKLVDVCVTDEHKLLVKREKYNKKLEKYNYILSKDLLKKGSLKFLTAVSTNSSYKIEDNYIKLIAWILTDGTITKNKSFIIYQSKNIDKIKNILDELNIGYNLTEKKQQSSITIKGVKVKAINKKMFVFTLNNKHTQNIEYLRTLINKKELPKWIYKLDKRQFDIFIKSYIDGDGTQRVDTSATIYGKYSILSELQAACTIHGHRTILSQNNRSDFSLSIVFDRDYSSFDLNNFCEIDQYVKYTWCFTLPNSNMIIRRNGKVSVQGNSGAFGYVVNSAFKQIMDHKYANVEVVNHKKFINYYKILDRMIILTHGKDARNLKFGFKPNIDSKSIEKIDQFFKNYKIYNMCSYITFSKGDSHQCLFDFCSSDDFDYNNYPAFSPSSEWVQTNFKRGRRGFVLEHIKDNGARVVVEPYFFKNLEY